MGSLSNVSHWLPCPVVFISTAFADKRDIMTATALFISEKEPLLMVSLAKGHLTSRLIEQAGEFTLIIAAENQKDLAEQLGSVRGDEQDKFERFSIPTLPAEPGKPLIPSDSSAWFACSTQSSFETAGYVVITAQVTNHQDLGNPPLVWQKGQLYGLRKL